MAMVKSAHSIDITETGLNSGIFGHQFVHRFIGGHGTRCSTSQVNIFPTDFTFRSRIERFLQKIRIIKNIIFIIVNVT